MNIEDFKELGFIGATFSFHPEGKMYTLNIYKEGQKKPEDILFKLKTSDCYCGYLWITNSKGFNSNLVSRKATPSKINKAIELGKISHDFWLD